MACKKDSGLLFLATWLTLVLQIHGQVQGGYWYPGSGISASDINSTLFTHLFCAFADLNSTTNQVVVSSANAQPFSTFTTDVQQTNPNVVTMMSIGGGASSPDDFANMASQPSTRQSFISSSICIARSYGFGGLDLDWEYPDTDDKMNNLGRLLVEWRAAITAEANSSGNAPLFLSAAAFYSPDYYGLNYPISAMSSSLDWINMMDYDFYGPGWSSVTGPPAALYNPGQQVSGDNGVTAWIQGGMPAQQMVLGFPFYGRAWTLQEASDNGFFAPATGAAISSDGAIAYDQIVSFISQNGATAAYNFTYVSNYCYSGTTWIGYDDTESISTKVIYAKEKGLLGYFTWNVGGDKDWTLSRQVSGDNRVTAWILARMPAQKMVLVIPFYGHGWTLQKANDNRFFAPTTVAATSYEGLTYNQIVKFISQDGATVVYNSSYVSNYCYLGKTWIGYDDMESVWTKVDYAKGKGLLGYDAWRVGGDKQLDSFSSCINRVEFLMATWHEVPGLSLLSKRKLLANE